MGGLHTTHVWHVISNKHLLNPLLDPRNLRGIYDDMTFLTSGIKGQEAIIPRSRKSCTNPQKCMKVNSPPSTSRPGSSWTTSTKGFPSAALDERLSCTWNSGNHSCGPSTYRYCWNYCFLRVHILETTISMGDTHVKLLSIRVHILQTTTSMGTHTWNCYL